ncbi:MAG TPA: BON domain-containing protein [Pyrinomonadaceae bacterium]|nr:BON domain-containing protein [Pyrinomonadaceae bacterium]
MAYDEEQARRSRVVVETPSERREVVHSQSVRTPDNSGISAGMVGVLVVVAIALITMLVLFWLSSQPTTDNSTLTAQQPVPTTTVVQQPAPVQQPPVIIQQPAPATQPAPIVVTPPAGGSTMPAESMNMDSTIQTAVDKRISDDPEISTLGITASVLNGKVMLVGTVKTEELKTRIERMVKQVKGVKEVDNQITVLA